MSSSSTTQIIAEYAKSGKSSCKKCSEKIDFKSLRLGLKFKDPRGYDNTKWHHVNCFFASDSDVPVPGVESIEGFEELTGSDQDKLKQMVSEADQVPTKRKGDDETESDRGDLKKQKTDEDKETGQEKKNVMNEKIIAEYAKSGRSSCKKCSEKIESKSLRLGYSSWDARGFENTKWHHLDCIFPLDADLVSADSIEGFSELKSSDQEKLKTLVTEGGQSSKKGSDEDKLKQMASEADQVPTKREGDDETESNRGDLKKLKTDEDKESGQEKKNVTNEKIIAEYAKSGRSSCKKCSEKIESKSLRLGYSSWDPRGFENTKWHHLDCIFPLDSDLVSADSIDGFSELKGSDQEKLKTLVTEGSQSSKKGSDQDKLKQMVSEADTDQVPSKREGDDETESDRGDIKKLKTDEDKENGQEKKNVTKEKIIAEYAKSGRSSCKKCSEKIESKSLRLGFSSWDPRGFENTKWHHLDCFVPLDADLVSAESIEGFSELKSNDQEKLKTLVAEGNQSSKKITGTLDKVIESEIAFEAGDVKDNYKGATLQPKWKAFQTIIYLERDDGLHDSKKIAAFDFDGCLAKTSVQRVGASAWSLMYASIPEKLQSLYNDGYKLVIFTNESNIERWKNKRQVAVDSKIGRLDSFIKLVKVPIQVYIACGVNKGQEHDRFRKPQPGMWRIMEQHFNSGIPVDMDQYRLFFHNFVFLY